MSRRFVGYGIAVVACAGCVALSGAESARPPTATRYQGSSSLLGDKQGGAMSWFPAALPASYAQTYASSLRSSRVAAAPRRFAGLTQVEVGWPEQNGVSLTPEGQQLVPRFVLVPADANHLAVDWGLRFDVRRADGSCILEDTKAPLFDVSVSNGAFFLYGNEILWDGHDGPSPKAGTGYSMEGAILALRYEGDRRVIAAQTQAEDPHVGGGGPWFLEVHQDRFTAPDRAAVETLAINDYSGTGLAAITADFRTVLVTEDRTLHVIAFEQGDPKTRRAPELVQRELPYRTRLLSIVPPNLFLVGDDAGGTLHCLSFDGSERWSLRLPFASGEEPPVDAGDGRVVVTGAGLASIENGRVLWSAPSKTPVLATAFQDGTLAVTTGPELRIVDRDGSIRQSLRASEDDVITTPPAIAHDGTVWVATQKALYVAR
jgi:hypothetical protein